MGHKPNANLPEARVVIREDAAVHASFGHGVMTPLAVTLDGHALRIDAISRRWSGWHRGAHLHYFDAQAGASRLKLCFHSGDACWMVKVMR